MSIGFASFKHLKLPVRTKIPVNCVYFHDSNITKFDFMNNAFAKLLLARLYLVMLFAGDIAISLLRLLKFWMKSLVNNHLSLN